MVKSNVLNDDLLNREPPNIFVAASTNDVIGLAMAMQVGQTLNDIERGTGFTPIHIACIKGSRDFLKVALSMDFDPWIRDGNERRSVEHALAQGLNEVVLALTEKLYPSGWSRGSITKIEPPGP